MDIRSKASRIGESLKTYKFWKEFIVITFAMTISAASIYYFLLPGKIVLGSISGLCIVIGDLLAKVGIVMKVSTIVLIINILLLILAYLILGSEFGIKTAYASLILGPLMNLCEIVCPYENLIEAGNTSIMGDIWLDMLGFILIVSIAQSILFNINASTGGLDIIAKILNKYFHTEIGASVTVAGLITCCTAFFIHPPRLVIIGLIGTWLNGVVIDYFMTTRTKKKRVCIIARNYEQIRDYIIKNIKRGCSLYELTGGYSGEKKVEIQALLTIDEFAKLMEYVRDNHKDAFITAGNVSEVYGIWSEKRKIGKH